MEENMNLVIQKYNNEMLEEFSYDYLKKDAQEVALVFMKSFKEKYLKKYMYWKLNIYKKFNNIDEKISDKKFTTIIKKSNDNCLLLGCQSGYLFIGKSNYYS